MAEAHSAVAFSFTVTHDGVDFNVNHEALWAVWDSGIRSWKRRLGKAKNKFKAGTYPGNPTSWLFITVLVLSLKLANFDPSFGMIGLIQNYCPGLSSASAAVSLYGSCIMFSTFLWLGIILFLKYTLKLLLMYHGWMFEARGTVSLSTKLWLGLIRVFGGRKPMLNSYQASMPKLVLPSIDDTISRYLESIKPLTENDKFQRMSQLAEEFRTGLGRKLQRYLILKSWWSTNYVTDWWEEYVYLRGRSPLMINSNYYGVDAVLIHPTQIQEARAANMTYMILQYRRELDREELNPILVNKTVPLCSAQYERQFNSTRIPGVETDRFVHFTNSKHIAVLHKGRFYKVYVHFKGRLLMPAELERTFRKILDDESVSDPSEEHIAAITAGDRTPWAKARAEYFSKGKNKASLDAIEKAAFFLSLDDEPQDFNADDPKSFDRLGKAMLHGNGHNRWFDKSFNLVVCSNGRIGFNAEHSWADAPVMAHLWEYAVASEYGAVANAQPMADAPIMAHMWETCTAEDGLVIGYTEDGHCVGEPQMTPPNPIRLEWELPQPCVQTIQNSLRVAKQLINDVDLRLLMHDAFGKGLMKKCRISPDAFIQMALQLAYFRDANKFCLTYESSMTRLFREGRTETVRPCTMDSTAFVRAMEDSSKTNEEKIGLLRKAAERHVSGYRDAMTGKGIDRHLFCLYVVSKYLEIDDSFLTEVLSEPWRLSTSQTPHQQTDKLDLVKNPSHLSGGGGFGPVADDGYGVSYIIAGENVIFFHISSKYSCATTDSTKFGELITQALADIAGLYNFD